MAVGALRQLLVRSGDWLQSRVNRAVYDASVITWKNRQALLLTLSGDAAPGAPLVAGGFVEQIPFPAPECSRVVGAQPLAAAGGIRHGVWQCGISEEKAFYWSISPAALPDTRPMPAACWTSFPARRWSVITSRAVAFR